MFTHGQYSVDINDNTGKFLFGTTYNYDIKFRLRCQAYPALPGMKLTTGFGPNALLVEPEITAFPVLLFVPPPMQQLRTIKHVETSIMAPVPSPFASSNTNAVNVSWQDIAKDSAEDSNVTCNYSQLKPITFELVTPIRVNRFEELLKGHLN